MKSLMLFRLGLLVLALMGISSATLSPTGINYEVVALTAIKSNLHDPYNVLENWDLNSVDPCSWRMVTCSPDGYVFALGLPSQSISGTLSPSIGNLSNLQSVLLQNNAISGPIPATIGKLEKLQTLDLSNNTFSGEIPTSLGDLKNLNYLRLNNNSLTGTCPDSLSNIGGLTLVDLSYNNLSGSLPKISARNFKVIGNPLICGHKAGNNCSAVFPEPLSLPPAGLEGDYHCVTDAVSFQYFDISLLHYSLIPCLNIWIFDFLAQSDSGSKGHRVAVGFGASFGPAFFIILFIGLLVWWRYRHKQQIFFDVNDHIHGRPALDWARRKRIALGTARGLLYLHEQCDPKIIHRDVKAANILLDEDFEAVVGDFGLAKLLDHRDSHVTTEVCGTVGHIAPEYLSTGKSSEKTDVFGFGILLLELITGQRALDFGRAANQKGVMLDWVKKLHQEGKLSLLVDKDIKGNFDRIELEEMVQVALFCSQFNPLHRPRMSEVLRTLEGDGLAEKWEALQKVETPRFRSCDNPPQRYSDFIEESSLVVAAMELSGPR
ncbi:protein NSP-INTERACTING KINASE 3-like isoform X3 [Durio zibethinus]|uniref:Protein NSP-INTERACTING KINASE 3-like isoform X3 n=1 Tax=Durio zibethinus TaxID=66656 RepID=A0A6P5XFW4_DURZI|nr:protein NSP-INTERACTING KINASE 3-like isoform X3 [Durio zibethinus]